MALIIFGCEDDDLPLCKDINYYHPANCYDSESDIDMKDAICQKNKLIQYSDDTIVQKMFICFPEDLN